MTLEEINERLDLFSEYMSNVYIELLPYVYTKKIRFMDDRILRIHDLPTFEYFLQSLGNEAYDLTYRPNTEVKLFDGERVYTQHHNGIPQHCRWIAYRSYKSWKGCNFNVSKWTFNEMVRFT